MTDNQRNELVRLIGDTRTVLRNLADLLAMVDTESNGSAETIVAAVCRSFSVPRSIVTSNRKITGAVEARTAAVYLLSQYCGMEASAMAKLLGWKSHKMIHVARLRAKSWMETDQKFRTKLARAADHVQASVFGASDRDLQLTFGGKAVCENEVQEATNG